MTRASRSSLGGVAICSVATVLLLVAISGARSPVRLANSGAPPWPAPTAASTGVRTAGLPLLSAPGVVTRYAVHLDVVAADEPVRVPPGIGVDWQAQALAPVYTSDNSGIVHISSDAADPVYRLGQFFDEWQVPLRDCTVYVNGDQQPGDPADVVLAPHQEILVSFGRGSAPGNVPVRYPFPAGK